MSRRVGTEAPRPDVAAKLDGTFEFSNDLAAPGMLFGATVRSPHPHARVLHVDAEPAMRLGARLVLTAADVPGSPRIGHIVRDQPVLADEVVRYHGEPVAFVVADTQEAAWRAAAAVGVTYRPLPVLDDPARALDDDAPLVHPSGNLVRRHHVRRGDPDGEEASAAVVVEGVWETGRQDQVFLAPESALAVPDADGGVTLSLATQDLHADQQQIADALDLPLELVRLRMSGIGGAFGGREDITLQVHLCLAALRAGRPVKTTYRRGESFLAHPKRHPARLEYRVGAAADGTLRFVRARIRLDGGAYASTSGPVAGSAAYFAAGPYRVPSVDVVVESVYTNNPVCGAMRGFGAVQACFGIESTLDLLADALGMDPVEVRRRNALRPGDVFPTSGQRVGDAAPVERLIDACTSLPLPQAAELPEGTRRGVGFALGVKNHLYAEGVPEKGTATVRVDGRGAEVLTPAAEVGQGIHGALLQIAADALGGLPVRIGDATTDLAATGSSSASRQTWISGGAVLDAALEAGAGVRKAVARRYGVAPEDVAPDGPDVLVGSDRVPLAEALGDEVVEITATRHAPPTERGDPFGQGDVHVSWMFVAHRAVVDVDVELGLVRVVQVATAQDVGRAVNPREVRRQIDGGIAQGIGLALLEHLATDGGVVLNAGLTDYLIPTAADVAPVEAVLVEVPDERGPLGMKGVGEPPSLSSTPAVAAAVRRATGRRVRRVPIRPEDLVL